MAVQYYCGRPGSGKSYGVLENVILPALQKNRLIYTNIPLEMDAILQDYPEAKGRIVQFTNETVSGDYLMAIPGGAIIIIDECWRFWAAGSKVNDIPMQEKEFFSEHRHKVGEDNLTQEIVLVSQSPSQIAKFVRDLIDQTVLTVKADKVGFSNRYQVQIYSACIPSIDRPGEPNQTGMGTYKPAIYKYYKSHTKSETGLPGIEIKADKRGSIWGHWYIRYVAPVVLVSSVWGVYYIYTFFTGEAFNKKEVVSEQKQEQLPARQQRISTDNVHEASQIKQIPITPQESTTMRIAGSITVSGVHIIYISHAARRKLTKATLDQCKATINGMECIVDGQLVTAHSGPLDEDTNKPPTLTSMVPKV